MVLMLPAVDEIKIGEVEIRRDRADCAGPQKPDTGASAQPGAAGQQPRHHITGRQMRDKHGAGA
jgi:hypothetical protein